MADPWFDKENLEKWLKTPVKQIVLEGGNAKGDNYLSVMKSVIVTSDDGRTFPLIFKCKLLKGKAAQVFGESGIFETEVELYKNIIPPIRNILKEAFPDDEELISADCYYACDDFLILENLIASGFEMKNRRVGLDLEQCLLVMRTLAKFHAASVMLHERNPRAFDKVDTSFLEKSCLQNPMRKFITASSLTMVEELKTWDEKWHKYIPKFELLARTSVDSVRKIYTRRDREINVLVHGDIWTNNMLIRGGSAEVRFVDFQEISYSSAVLDLHYFIGTSPIMDVRANHEDNLIKEYHKNLAHTLSVLRYKNHIPTLEELQQEYDRKALYGIYSLIAAYGAIQCDPEVGFSFDDVVESGKTPGPKMYSEYFKEIVKIVLPVLDRKGAFDSCM